MEKFNTTTVYRDGFVVGLWALPTNINLTDQKKSEIKTLVNEKAKPFNSKFSVLFKVEWSDDYMGCNSIDVFIKAITSSVT